MRLLIVEDNEELAELLAKGLKTAGYQCDVLSTVEDARAVLATTFYAALILDLGLPDGDGLELLREIRQRDNPVPVLVLTARGGLHDRVHGLRSGADDYLVKPFDIEEFVARVRALVRRTEGYTRIRCGELEIDRLGRQASVGGRQLALTARELSLLLRLAGHADKVVTRTDLLANVWEASFDTGSNIVEAHMSRLRAKLGDHASMIETVRGVGYRLCSGGAPSSGSAQS
jgi:DNA-binding response OmpR family regulator